jgi:cytoskeletal protein RodZ
MATFIMTKFRTSQISEHTRIAGQELKQAREARGFGLEEAASRSGINRKHLVSMESGDFEALPEGLYGRKIIADYAAFLGTDGEWLVELFSLETDNEQKRQTRCQNAFARKLPQARYFFTLPKIFKSAFILLAVAVCAGYLTYCVKNAVEPPELVLANPIQDQVTSEPYITVQGNTEKEAEITINGRPILAGPNGAFEERISLKKGLNVISVVARTKYSQQAEVTKKVIFTDQGA